MSDYGRVNDAAFRYYDRLRRVKKYVDHHYDEPFSLREAARIAGCETKYFSAFFHQKTGICFREWLASVRVERAAELLQRRNHTITHVAFTVGFQDLRTFERAFKRCKGMTPRAFKRAVRPA